jgi:ribosome maturation factor RimP
MEYSEINEELNKIIQPALEENGFELIELIFAQSRSNSTVTILVDRVGGGINLGDCTMLNRKIGELLDAADIIRERYSLEVSSPGIDRPLERKNDFLRCVGKSVKFFLREAINGKIEFDAKVCQADEEAVKVETRQGIWEIPLSNINKAKQII